MPRKKLKYPYLFGTADELFPLELRDYKHGGMTTLKQYDDQIDVLFYKGAVLLRVYDQRDKDKWFTISLASDTLEALVDDLTVRAEQWRDAYRRAKKELARDLRSGKLTIDSRGHTPGGRRARRELGMRDRIRPAKKRV